MVAPLIWNQKPCDNRAADALQRALGIEPITARLLCLRGLDTPDAAARFLKILCLVSLPPLWCPTISTGMPLYTAAPVTMA